MNSMPIVPQFLSVECICGYIYKRDDGPLEGGPPEVTPRKNPRKFGFLLSTSLQSMTNPSDSPKT